MYLFKISTYLARQTDLPNYQKIIINENQPKNIIHNDFILL